MKIQADPASPERDALYLQTKTLFPTLLAGQGDPAARADHTVPWQSFPGLQRQHGQTRRARESDDLSHLAVGDDFSPGYASNHGSKVGEQGHRFA
jgi:hypothetical protein